MYILGTEQAKHHFTIDEKKDVPMYEAVKENESKQSSNKDGVSSDDLEKREFKAACSPRRILAPPEYPFAYYRLKKDQKCAHCDRIGKNCHNIRYGGYLAAVVAHYHNKHTDDYNEHDEHNAVRLFVDTYTIISKFEDYLYDASLDSISNNVLLPQCMAFDSLPFALNSVEWTVLWNLSNKKKQRLVKTPKNSNQFKKSPAKNDSNNKN